MLTLTLALIGPSVCPVGLSPPLRLLGAPSQPASLTARSLGLGGGPLWYVPGAALATAPTPALAERRCHPPTLAPYQRRSDCAALRSGGSPHRRKVDLRLAAAEAQRRACGGRVAPAWLWPPRKQSWDLLTQLRPLSITMIVIVPLRDVPHCSRRAAAPPAFVATTARPGLRDIRDNGVPQAFPRLPCQRADRSADSRNTR